MCLQGVDIIKLTINNPKPILVKNVRVFNPYEYDLYVSSIDKGYLRRRFLILFWSGMRYVEFQRFHAHPEWWDPSRKVIDLPAYAEKKTKRSQRQRYIHPLPDLIGEILEQFFLDPKPPTLQTWNANLKRWAEKAELNPIGLSAKSTRKSIESWMIRAGMPVHEVYLRQGHDELTSLRHYQGLPFTDSELQEIKRKLAGMM